MYRCETLISRKDSHEAHMALTSTALSGKIHNTHTSEFILYISRRSEIYISKTISIRKFYWLLIFNSYYSHI